MQKQFAVVTGIAMLIVAGFVVSQQSGLFDTSLQGQLAPTGYTGGSSMSTGLTGIYCRDGDSCGPGTCAVYANCASNPTCVMIPGCGYTTSTPSTACAGQGEIAEPAGCCAGYTAGADGVCYAPCTGPNMQGCISSSSSSTGFSCRDGDSCGQGTCAVYANCATNPTCVMIPGCATSSQSSSSYCNPDTSRMCGSTCCPMNDECGFDMRDNSQYCVEVPPDYCDPRTSIMCYTECCPNTGGCGYNESNGTGYCDPNA